MGKDNTARDRQRHQLERKKQKQRAPCERILIVSEGSKTEPLYFEEIRIDQRLGTANIAVIPSGRGTAPKQVVEYARDLFMGGDLHKGIEPRVFDEIYCVFDRDKHPSYFDALRLAKSLDGKLKNDEKKPALFKAIVSVPSFELSLLLHYEDVQVMIEQNELLHRLKQYIPDYEKGKRGVFTDTRTQLNIAMKRAEILATGYEMGNDRVPYTEIFELVKRLMKLRR